MASASVAVPPRSVDGVASQSHRRGIAQRYTRQRRGVRVPPVKGLFFCPSFSLALTRAQPERHSSAQRKKRAKKIVGRKSARRSAFRSGASFPCSVHQTATRPQITDCQQPRRLRCGKRMRGIGAHLPRRTRKHDNLLFIGSRDNPGHGITVIILPLPLGVKFLLRCIRKPERVDIHELVVWRRAFVTGHDAASDRQPLLLAPPRCVPTRAGRTLLGG